MALSQADVQKPFDLQRYLLDLLDLNGAVAETPGFALVEALLPAETAAALEVPAHVLLAFDYEVATENPGAEFVTFGSPLLDRAINLGKTLGKATKKYAAPEHLAIPPGMLERVEKKMDFLNCRRPSLLSTSLLQCEYVRFNFAVRFLSDEKQEAGYPVLIDTLAGNDVSYQIPWLKGIFFAETGEALAKAPPGSHCGYARAYELAKEGLPMVIDKDLTAFWRRMTGYLGVEEKRLQTYYTGTREEIIKRTAKLAAGDPRREKLEQKLAATEADYRMRLEDLRNKFHVSVEAHLESVAVYVLPKVKILLNLQHRTHTASLELYYNLAANQLELPYCPQCREPFSVVHMTRDGAIRCPVCAG
ncbi:hypothetical protein SY88_11410 [Clostridiales bacterium PH28_bin88]|nr:hypothetical protein SY88_11410 [Clostridiales bacterium PH28_bin88]